MVAQELDKSGCAPGIIGMSEKIFDIYSKFGMTETEMHSYLFGEQSSSIKNLFNDTNHMKGHYIF